MKRKKHVSTRTRLGGWSWIPVVCLVPKMAFADNHSSDFAFELGGSIQKSLSSIDPGWGVNGKIIWKGIWLDVEYHQLFDLDYEINGVQVIHDTSNIVGKLGYEWKFEEKLHISPYFGVATNLEDADDELGSIANPVIYKANEVAFIGGVEVGVMLSQSFKLSFSAAYMSAFGVEDDQGLLGFKLSWRPSFGESSRSDYEEEQVEEVKVEEEQVEDAFVNTMSFEEEMPSSGEDITTPESEEDIQEPAEVAPVDASLADDVKSPSEMDMPVADPEPFEEAEPVPKPTVKPRPPTAKPKPVSQEAVPDSIRGVDVLMPNEVSYKYGIQMGFFPSPKYAKNMLDMIAERFDMSTVFVVKYADGYRIFYEGFQDRQPAKDVLGTLREEFKDVFIKKF